MSQDPLFVILRPTPDNSPRFYPDTPLYREAQVFASHAAAAGSLSEGDSICPSELIEARMRESVEAGLNEVLPGLIGSTEEQLHAAIPTIVAAILEAVYGIGGTREFARAVAGEFLLSLRVAPRAEVSPAVALRDDASPR